MAKKEYFQFGEYGLTELIIIQYKINKNDDTF